MTFTAVFGNVLRGTFVSDVWREITYLVQISYDLVVVLKAATNIDTLFLDTFLKFIIGGGRACPITEPRNILFEHTKVRSTTEQLYPLLYRETAEMHNT